MCWSIIVRVWPFSGGSFSPVVSWAVHVSVGNEIQRVTIKSNKRGKWCVQTRCSEEKYSQKCIILLLPWEHGDTYCMAMILCHHIHRGYYLFVVAVYVYVQDKCCKCTLYMYIHVHVLHVDVDVYWLVWRSVLSKLSVLYEVNPESVVMNRYLHIPQNMGDYRKVIKIVSLHFFILLLLFDLCISITGNFDWYP